jgi:hypothetical protein
MATPYQPAISGNRYKNNGGTLLNGGNHTEGLVITKSPKDIARNLGYGGKIVLAVSAATSGHLGTYKPYSAGTFAYVQQPDTWIAIRTGTKISGVTTSRLQSGATDVSLFRAIPKTESCRRLNITSWSYTTHAATKGGSAGDLSSFGQDHAARPTNAIPGELVFFVGNSAVQYDYKPKTNP